MPQIGQAPGAERTISGCMGQVYSTRVCATGTSGSRAMPQEGQAPGLLSRTSGHIGQTYAQEGWVLGGTGGGGADGLAGAPPRITKPEVGVEDFGWRYFPGSDLNFSPQDAQQK